LSRSATATREQDDLRERRCIVTGEVLQDAKLIRFVVGPEGDVVPDIAAQLPGRGMWVSADRNALERAISRNLFAKAAKAAVRASQDLVQRTERLIAQRMTADLGLARRSGALVVGFDNVARALERPTPPSVLVEAHDGAPDGRRKLLALARARNLAIEIIDCLDSKEISLALGRENVIHAALKSGRLSERLVIDAGRLNGFRAAAKNSAGSNPARHERDE